MYTWYFINVLIYFTDSKVCIKNLICVVHSCKKFNSIFHEEGSWKYRCSSSTGYQKKRTDWILRIFTFNDKNLLYLPKISTLHCFGCQSDQGVTQLVIKSLGISQSSRIVSSSWKNARFFQSPFYFPFIF